MHFYQKSHKIAFFRNFDPSVFFRKFSTFYHKMADHFFKKSQKNAKKYF